MEQEDVAMVCPPAYFRVRPHRVQAWRESNEIKGRDLMRDGDWIVPG